MKCSSVACLWPPAPPPHRVTATAVLLAAAGDLPAPALFTGGSDGSVFRWDISTSEVRPAALLCGHAAPIAGLAPCSPHDPKPDPRTSNPNPNPHTALLSACVDGVLCVWAGGSSRCRRRRKLPPWAGTPAMMAPLPSSPRHVCLVCTAAADSTADGDVGPRRAPKWAVVIVDSSSLNVLQTVFYGSLSIGPVKAMAVVPVAEDGIGKGEDVILVDGHGKMQRLAAQEANHDGQGGSFLHASSSSDAISVMSAESSSDQLQAVAVADDGRLLALIFGSCCVFRSVSNDVDIGEISLVGSSLCNEEPSTTTPAQLSGGMFLEGIDGGNATESKNSVDDFVNSFAVWSNGAVAVYKISASGVTFRSELLCEIPAAPYMANRKESIHFCQLNDCLLRIQSVCSIVGESLICKPYVTKWLVAQSESSIDDTSNSRKHYASKLVGEGGFPTGPGGTWFSPGENEPKDGAENSSQPKSAESSKILNGLHRDYGGKGLDPNERIISSSMVLSEDFYCPYAVVYGFYNGEIEVLQLVNFNPEVNSDGSQIYPEISERYFSGHTGAVLCLAAHCMIARSEERKFHRVLVSGSMDSTVRIWNLDTGCLLMVMHHHIAPVRQIILPPPWTNRPWNDCFLSVGEDCCVALVSLETLRVERMFPGHSSYPSMVAWDSTKSYVACLCRNMHSPAEALSVLYLWDVKTGARERIIRGTASHSMFDHFCRNINKNSISGSILGGATSASSLLPIFKDANSSQSHVTKIERDVSITSSAGKSQRTSSDSLEMNSSVVQVSRGKLPLVGATHDISHDLAGNSSARQLSSYRVPLKKKKYPIKSYCPFPGIASLKFDLFSLISPESVQHSDIKVGTHASDHENKKQISQNGTSDDDPDVRGGGGHSIAESAEGCLLRFSLCFLHLWDIDHELDKSLVDEMNVCKPEGCHIASGLVGDRGSVTVMLPGLHSTLELWRSSSEFCAMRSLTMVSLAQRMISLCHSCTTASSALAAFYTRNFAEKVPAIKPPSLQLLVSFWQHPSEHVRMAARSLFHCAAPRAVPHALFSQKILSPKASSHLSDVMERKFLRNKGNESVSGDQDACRSTDNISSDDSDTSSIISWLESFELQEWISWIGGTSQDAMAANIIVAAALIVWYPSIVKDKLAELVVNELVKLVMSMNDRYSSTAAELLAEAMESTWEACLGSEIPHLIGDIFFQIECLSGLSTNNPIHSPAVAVTIREALVGILLPSLAMADILGFLNIIEGQIWATASDSPVHLVSLKTIIRMVRGAPKPLAPYLDKVINFVLQTMDPSNLVMRKACLNSSMITMREIARVFPMVALNETSTRLAVGDAIGDIHSVTIRVYDIESVTKIKILDASGPPGLPSLLEGVSNTKITTAISALSFSPDGEGLVAFSENGLMIRWWSLGIAWWEKLSRSFVPVQCTKLIFVPPWEGFSPNSSGSSIMASILGHDKSTSSQDKTRGLNDADNLKLLVHNLDLSYRLHWSGGRNITLTRHGQELGTFQL